MIEVYRYLQMLSKKIYQIDMSDIALRKEQVRADIPEQNYGGNVQIYCMLPKAGPKKSMHTKHWWNLWNALQIFKKQIGGKDWKSKCLQSSLCLQSVCNVLSCFVMFCIVLSLSVLHWKSLEIWQRSSLSSLSSVHVAHRATSRETSASVSTELSSTAGQSAECAEWKVKDINLSQNFSYTWPQMALLHIMSWQNMVKCDIVWCGQLDKGKHAIIQRNLVFLWV